MFGVEYICRGVVRSILLQYYSENVEQSNPIKCTADIKMDSIPLHSLWPLTSYESYWLNTYGTDLGFSSSEASPQHGHIAWNIQQKCRRDRTIVNCHRDTNLVCKPQCSPQLPLNDCTKRIQGQSAHGGTHP